MPATRLWSPVRTVLLALFVFSTTPGFLSGQARGGILTPQERLQALFAQVSPAEHVQVVTPLIFVEDAEFVAVGRSVVELNQAGTPVSVELADIRSVSVRAGHSLQGALWGAGSGVLVGAVSGMMAASFTCVTPEACSSAEKEGALRWGTLFGVVGAATGFVIGRYNVYWKPIFP